MNIGYWDKRRHKPAKMPKDVKFMSTTWQQPTSQNQLKFMLLLHNRDSELNLMSNLWMEKWWNDEQFGTLGLEQLKWLIFHKPTWLL
jgi:hypothetical protein